MQRLKKQFKQAPLVDKIVYIIGAAIGTVILLAVCYSAHRYGVHFHEGAL
jgi:hypothetical protein